MWNPPAVQVRDRKVRLPDSYTPSPYSVHIGRGKLCAEATGNKRLKVIVSNFLEEYSKAPTRIEKSVIVSKIVDIVHEACPVGAFIKYEDGAWWQVPDNAARERVGSMLRDSLHEQYRSSSKSKLARRRSSRATNKDDETGPISSVPGTMRQSSCSREASASTASSLSSLFDDENGQKKGVALKTTVWVAEAPPRTSIKELPSSSDKESLIRIDLADVLTKRLPSQSAPFSHVDDPGKVGKTLPSNRGTDEEELASGPSSEVRFKYNLDKHSSPVVWSTGSNDAWELLLSTYQHQRYQMQLLQQECIHRQRQYDELIANNATSAANRNGLDHAVAHIGSWNQGLPSEQSQYLVDMDGGALALPGGTVAFSEIPPSDPLAANLPGDGDEVIGENPKNNLSFANNDNVP